jgi:hypothetical protein
MLSSSRVDRPHCPSHRDARCADRAWAWRRCRDAGSSPGHASGNRHPGGARIGDPNSEYRICRATAADADKTAQLITVAFVLLEVSAWLVPNPRERLRRLEAYFGIWVDHAVKHGEIDLIWHDLDDTYRVPVAVSMWFPALTGPIPEPEDYDARLESACGPDVDRFQILNRHLSDTHPHEFPHHYLAYHGTRPGYENGRRGSALLNRHHQHLDEKGIPAFLHARTTYARDIYHRRGYQPRSAPFYLPSGPPIWPMWREPHQPKEPENSQRTQASRSYSWGGNYGLQIDKVSESTRRR